MSLLQAKWLWLELETCIFVSNKYEVWNIFPKYLDKLWTVVQNKLKDFVNGKIIKTYEIMLECKQLLGLAFEKDNSV